MGFFSWFSSCGTVGDDEPPSLIDDGVQDAEGQDFVRYLVHERHHGLLVRRRDVGAQAVGATQRFNRFA